jgi:uncharacterized protein (PEP-CTERM system associated)
MTRRRAEPRALALALALAAGASQAQQTDPGAAQAVPPGASIQPRISVMETWTDNLRLDDRAKDAALITTVSPGISILRNSGMLRGSLDYTLNGIAYVKSTQASALQNALRANGTAELIENHLYVEANANIGQQTTSAFGQLTASTLTSQGSVANLADQNRREVITAYISPVLRGRASTLASYELRTSYTQTEVRRSALGDSRGNGSSLRFDGIASGPLNWWLLASTQQTRPVQAPSNRMSSVTAGLTYHPDTDWTFTANAGRERTDYLGNGTRSGMTGGLNAQWTPTPRTRIGADWQHHEYGNSHALTFEHRMARSVWSLSDTESVMTGNTGASGGVRTVYDQYFLLFATQEPDPIKRDALVRNYLLSQGLSPDAPVGNGFLSSGPSRLHSQLGSVALQGVRSSLTATASRSVTTRLGTGLNQGDLANSSRVEQRSYSLTASHQLTPASGLSLTASRQQSLGDLSSQSMTLTSLSANWNSRLGPRLSAQLGARRSRFEGVTPYTENAAYGSLTQQF